MMTTSSEGVGETALHCVICTDAPSQYAVVPCGHMCGCDPCLMRVYYADDVAMRVCPICRAPMTHRPIRVFMQGYKALSLPQVEAIQSTPVRERTISIQTLETMAFNSAEPVRVSMPVFTTFYAVRAHLCAQFGITREPNHVHLRRCVYRKNGTIRPGERFTSVDYATTLGAFSDRKDHVYLELTEPKRVEARSGTTGDVLTYFERNATQTDDDEQRQERDDASQLFLTLCTWDPDAGYSRPTGTIVVPRRMTVSALKFWLHKLQLSVRRLKLPSALCHSQNLTFIFVLLARARRTNRPISSSSRRKVR